MSSREIVVTDRDLWWLRALVRARARMASRDQAHLQQLEQELGRAVAVDAADLPAGVVTMHARAQVRDVDTGAARTYTLVFPHEADVLSGRLSVLAPLGTALLGYREGDEITWEMPGGARRLRIEKVRPASRSAARQAATDAPPRGRAALPLRPPSAGERGRGASLPRLDGAA